MIRQEFLDFSDYIIRMIGTGAFHEKNSGLIVSAGKINNGTAAVRKAEVLLIIKRDKSISPQAWPGFDRPTAGSPA